ncbi:hypothetical protein [Dysgonomonas sp. PH5-37]|uniref:hypothetical protein n=2 Tax=unclassified Dysgonomonas TaxID=2630389 RepID=UPI0024749159|nr:hypothetical protein [Dysgonomonas sp. PH5-37]
MYAFWLRMEDKYEKLLQNLELRMRQLMFLCDSLREENNTLKEELKKKEKEAESISLMFTDMQSEYNNVKFARSYTSANKADIEKAKAKLLKLVQDVDKCISLLKM